MEALQEQAKAQSALITELEAALDLERKEKQLHKASSELKGQSAELYKSQAEANKEGWLREEKESQRLRKQLKSSHTKTKLAVIAGIAGAVTLYLLK